MSRKLAAPVAALLVAALSMTGCSSGGGDRTAGLPTTPARPNPLGAAKLYVDPDGPAPRQVAQWHREGKRIEAQRLQAIARQPVPTWLTGREQDPYATVRDVTAAAQREGRLPAFVLYNVPGRDCGLYSSGGAADVDAYLIWVGSAAAALGRHKAVFVVEPDAIAQAVSGCLGTERAAQRMGALRAAIDILERQPGAVVYVDAGNASWVKDTDALATALRTSGVDHADGFALNVANFETTSSTVGYARAVSARLNGAHYVVDTSRNGSGPPPQDVATQKEGHRTWCNPEHAHIGTAPTTDTGVPALDALMWVKQPGDSDGSCHAGAPKAGTWWPTYALKLVD
jgi:endoglucanase